MASLYDFLADLRREGVTLAASGDVLKMRAKRTVGPATLREIAALKPWLLAYLRAQALPEGDGLAGIVDGLAACGAQLETSPAGLTLTAGTMPDFDCFAERWLKPWAAEAARIKLLWPGAAAAPAA